MSKQIAEYGHIMPTQNMAKLSPKKLIFRRSFHVTEGVCPICGEEITRVDMNTQIRFFHPGVKPHTRRRT